MTMIQEVNLQIWDTTGEERFRSLTPMYFRDALHAILVIDLTIPIDADSLNDWMNMLKTYGPAEL